LSSSTQEHRQSAPSRLRFSVLTISDTRTLENDHSGQLICSSMATAGHELVQRQIVPDEPLQIASHVCQLTAEDNLDVLLMTGGTGISPRDRTPEAVAPLLDVELPGFGELFRMLSYAEIGPATMLSRALAGRRGSVLVFCLPGSRAAVSLAVEKILVPELPHLVHHSRG
jgi:molybdenum cofactor biosynthesis protein B